MFFGICKLVSIHWKHDALNIQSCINVWSLEKILKKKNQKHYRICASMNDYIDADSSRVFKTYKMSPLKDIWKCWITFGSENSFFKVVACRKLFSLWKDWSNSKLLWSTMFSTMNAVATSEMIFCLSF